MFYRLLKCFVHPKWWLATRVSPSEKRIRNLLSLRAKDTIRLTCWCRKSLSILRSTMLSCMGVLGIHPLDSQYKVTVGNVAEHDFLNCHDSCDFNRLEAWYTWPIRSQCFLTQGWTNPFRFLIGNIRSMLGRCFLPPASDSSRNWRSWRRIRCSYSQVPTARPADHFRV